MGVMAFGGQAAALGYPEAMLLVGNHQPQLPKHRGIRQQSVGAHHHLKLPCLHRLPGQPLFLHAHGAGEQPHGDSQRGKELSQRGAVLLCQDLRGSHQGSLLSVPGGAEGRSGGHHGLAAAHITLHQPVHGGASAQIPDDVLHCPALCPGEGKGQRPIKFR